MGRKRDRKRSSSKSGSRDSSPRSSRSKHTDKKADSRGKSSHEELRREVTPEKRISIEDFDALKFQLINSPRSLKAMETLGIGQEDLRLKTEEDMLGLFNLEDPRELEALHKCVEKRKETHKRLVHKISRKRRDIIKSEEKAEAKRLEHEKLKAHQLQRLEEEKKNIMKQLEIEKKKKEDFERRQRIADAKRGGLPEQNRDPRRNVRSPRDSSRT